MTQVRARLYGLAMRIGLTGGGTTADRIVQQAVEAEADGFTSLWYASAVFGDPLVAMALAGRATKTIELGTSVLQTYTCHPVLQANRGASTAAAMGRPGFTLGVGPSHRPVIEDAYGLSYDDAGGTHRGVRHGARGASPRRGCRRTTASDFRVHIPVTSTLPQPVSLMISALAPRLLQVAGERTDGTILWMANAGAIDTHVAPRMNAAATAAGRPKPRIVAGLPVAVHDDVTEARQDRGRDVRQLRRAPELPQDPRHRRGAGARRRRDRG